MDFAAAAPGTGTVVPLERAAHVPCVLIVDDDAATRMLCSVNLQLEGLRVLEAADGRHGLARAQDEQPDLVLTDVMMPGLDGFELAEALRRDNRTSLIPLIFLSKPFDPLALASLVAGVLARPAPQQAA